MLLRNVVVAALLTGGLGAVASAQSSAQQPVKLTGIEGKIELVGTGNLPPANPLAFGIAYFVVDPGVNGGVLTLPSQIRATLPLPD